MIKLSGLLVIQSGWRKTLKQTTFKSTITACGYLFNSQKNHCTIQKPLFKNAKKTLYKEAQTILTTETQQSSWKNNLQKQQRKQQEKYPFLQKPTKKLTLNPTQSLLSHIMRTSSIDTFIELYSQHKQHFNPRLLSIAARSLCSLCEKEKTAESPQQMTKKLQPFLNDIFGLKVSSMREEIKKQCILFGQMIIELKNMLFFTKKSLNELNNIFDLNAENTFTFNQQLYLKAQQFRSQITQTFLTQDFDFEHYEVNELIQIYYELIRLSTQYETPKIYQAILKNKEKIEESVNPQFLFSTGSFLLTVKTIQMDGFTDKNAKLTQNKAGKLFSREKGGASKARSQQQEIRHLRTQCYRLFLKKWLYYYNDMSEFIKLEDLKHSWPLIIQSHTGAKVLLEEDNGVEAMKVVVRVLQIHKMRLGELLISNLRVLGNNTILLQLLCKEPQQTPFLNQIKTECTTQISNLPAVDKQRTKLRMRTFLQKLNREKIISNEEQQKVLDRVNEM